MRTNLFRSGQQRFTPSIMASLILISCLPLTASATVIGDVALVDRTDYVPIYQFSPTALQNWSTTSYYTTNNSGTPLPLGFSRIGYYMEFQAGAGPRSWVWVSMNAFTNNLTKIGVPTTTNGELYHYGNTAITDMTVRSNVGSIVTGTNITTGNIEFWPSDYLAANAFGVPGATASYDFGDQPLSGTGYGSMQLHNYGASQVLFAYNQFNGGNGDLGIGGSADYTFASNASGYTLRNIEIWVQEIQPIPAPEPSSMALLGLGTVGLIARRRRSHGQHLAAK